MNLLQSKGVAAAALMNQGDAYADPHLNARGYFQMVHSPEAGSYPFPGPPWRFSESPNAIERPSPALGEHNEYVYKELLGFSDEEYQRYIEMGHIGDAPPL
jgi:crotonobetainyl-CoA:carnitine CoA-transferase CaiB-like acyl-CoA transferase